MNLKDRYDRDHIYGDVIFHLSDYLPEREQWRFLMLKVLEQAVRDYCALVESDLPNEKLLWKEARDFIFDKNYHIMWGELELSLEEYLDILDIDVDWFREQTMKKFRNRHGDKYE